MIFVLGRACILLSKNQYAMARKYQHFKASAVSGSKKLDDPEVEDRVLKLRIEHGCESSGRV